MRKRLFLYTSILMLPLLVMLQVVEVTEANPLSRGLPNQGEFGITIESPSNNTLFKNNNIPLNFTVSYTEQWNSYPYWCRIASIASIEVYLDGNLSIQHTSNQVDYYLNGTKTTYAKQNGPNNCSDWLNKTSPGQHMLNVTANFSIQYRDNIMGYSYPEAVTKVAYFTVELQEPSASIAPSSATDLLSNSITPLAVASVIAIVAVVLVFLVYSKRREKLTGK